MLCDMTPGDRIRGEALLITAAEVGAAKNGPYLALTLRDSSRALEGRLWQVDDEQRQVCQPGEVIRVWGALTSYRGEIQIGVDQVAECTDVLPRSEHDPAVLLDLLRARISECVRQPLQRVVMAVLDGPYHDHILSAPAASRNHHAYVGGLLEHTLGLVELAVSTCETLAREWPRLIDLSILVAGAALHDIGKAVEIDPASGYTTPGRLRGHLVIGVDMVQDALQSVELDELESLDELHRDVAHLEHLILSHHGQRDWGSPVVPQTPEAVLLHQLDMIHSRMAMVAEAVEGVEPGLWSEKIRALGTAIYVALRS